MTQADNCRTSNFLRKTLRAFFGEEGFSHNTSSNNLPFFRFFLLLLSDGRYKRENIYGNLFGNFYIYITEISRKRRYFSKCYIQKNNNLLIYPIDGCSGTAKQQKLVFDTSYEGGATTS